MENQRRDQHDERKAQYFVIFLCIEHIVVCAVFEIVKNGFDFSSFLL